MIKWDNSDYLIHFGIKGRSGRYKAGSGKNPKTGPRAKMRIAKRGVDRKGNTFTQKELGKMIIPSPKSYGSVSKRYSNVKVTPVGFFRRQMQMEAAGTKGLSNYYKRNADMSRNPLTKGLYNLASAGYGGEAKINSVLNKKLYDIDQKQIDKGKQILVDKTIYRKVLSERKARKQTKNSNRK